MGSMFALGKPCVGLQTDVRRALPSGNNPMIGQSLAAIVNDLPQLVERVANLARRFHDTRLQSA
ncbi:MAG: hypothetical protein L6R19_11675 [Alphaproteobacteria bacterium]|nr:hypothetical protein [Alphaproteobacteria bacterium]